MHENIENAKSQGQSEKAKDLEAILDRFKKAPPF
jgi:hypothetical protein